MNDEGRFQHGVSFGNELAHLLCKHCHIRLRRFGGVFRAARGRFGGGSGFVTRGVLLFKMVVNGGEGERGRIGFELRIELFGELRQFCKHGTGLCADMGGDVHEETESGIDVGGQRELFV